MALAAEPTLAGRWASGDAAKPRAVIEMRVQGPSAVGTIVEFFPQPGEDPDPVCEECPGAARGKKIRGLEIVRLAREPDGQWRGSVLDPEEGREYRAVAELEDGGARLALRGYVGLPVFGRTERWTRLR